jgi:hypothetical protein
MPRTRFNRAISGHRVFAASSLPVPEVKALAKSQGVTINDVVLALCAGALRRYLTEHEALPKKPLTAGIPVSLRPPGNTQLNNQVFFTLSHLPTDVADPLPRLAAAQAAGKEAKNLFADMRDLVTTDLSLPGAPLVVMSLTRLWVGARAANYLRPFFNTVISNVPGPRLPMYCVGAPATHYFPVSIPYHGCALNITVQSYLDQLDFGLVACSETVPDAQRIADFLVEDFSAMREADRQQSRSEKIEATTLPQKPGGLAEVEPVVSKVDRRNVLKSNIEALSVATEALLRPLDSRACESAKAQLSVPKPKSKQRKLASVAPAVSRAAKTGPRSHVRPASLRLSGKHPESADHSR